MSKDTKTTERPLRADALRNRERILEAASELFARDGLDVSLDDIAAHAKVGVGTVYRRFPDRETLIAELFESRLEAFVEVAEECAAMPDAWEGLTTFIATGSLMQGKDSALRELMIGTGGISRVLATKPRLKLAPLVGSMVERAKASGQLRADFEVFDVPITEMMLARVFDITGSVEPEVWRRHLTLVIDGMRAKGATPMPVPGLTPDQYTEALSRLKSR